MGKSVLLQQVEDLLHREPGTHVIRIDSPPEEATVAGAVCDLAARLGIRNLVPPRMDDLLDRVLGDDATRLVVLIDEADAYVTLGSMVGDFARAWFDKLEATRKQWDSRFNIVFAGGLGLLYLEHELGSGIVSRADPCVLDPFCSDDVADLAVPFREDGRFLDEACMATLVALSGGIPALVTYGLEQLWESASPNVEALKNIFGTFRERHDSFVRAVRASVSRRGRLDAPWRVLEEVRGQAGTVSLESLRDACAPRNEHVAIDYKQALDLLRAAGLVRIEGSMSADPIAAWPIASILNLPEKPASSGEPLERLIQDVCAVLANLHRFGRDFHDGDKLLREEVFSSLIAVGLRLLGWLETDREAIQRAGFTDVKVRLTRPGLDGHVLVEAKIWRGAAYNKDIQRQVDDYRVAETRHGIAVTLGARDEAGWPEDYEASCLAGRCFERLKTPTDLVGRWRVQETDPQGHERRTDHLLVQIPKRR